MRVTCRTAQNGSQRHLDNTDTHTTTRALHILETVKVLEMKTPFYSPAFNVGAQWVNSPYTASHPGAS